MEEVWYDILLGARQTALASVPQAMFGFGVPFRFRCTLTYFTPPRDAPPNAPHKVNLHDSGVYNFKFMRGVSPKGASRGGVKYVKRERGCRKITAATFPK